MIDIHFYQRHHFASLRLTSPLHVFNNLFGYREMFSFVKRYLLLFDSQRQFEQQHSRPQVWRLAAFLLFTMSCCIDSAAGEDPAAPKDKALPAAGTKGAEHYAPGTVLRELPKPSATGPISPSKWNLADLRPRVEERLSSITSLHVRYKVWLKGHEQDFESWEWAFQGKQRLIRSDLTSLEAASPRRLWYSFDGTRGFRVNDFDQEYSLEPGVDVFDEPPPRIDFVDEMRTVIGLEVPYSDFTVAEIMRRSDIRKHGLFLHPWAVKPEDVGKTKAADLAEKSDYMFELGPFGEGGRKTNVLQLAVDPRHGCCPSMLRVVSVRLNDAIQSHALDKSKPFEARDGEYSLLTHVERFTEVLDSVSGKEMLAARVGAGIPLAGSNVSDRVRVGEPAAGDRPVRASHAFRDQGADDVAPRSQDAGHSRGTDWRRSRRSRSRRKSFGDITKKGIGGTVTAIDHRSGGGGAAGWSFLDVGLALRFGDDRGRCVRVVAIT